MRTRRLENIDKNRFWEVFWELGDVEVISGALGTKGRAKRHELNAITATQTLAEAELPALRYLSVSSNPLESAANPLKAALKQARGIGRYEDDD
jgi:hypothetical protein